MIGVGFLLKRQQDVDADAFLPAGADLSRFHDAAGRAGDDHPSGLSNAPAELHRLEIRRIRRRQPGRAEHRHLAHGAVRREDFEGKAQFFESGIDELDVHACGAVAEELVGGLTDLLDELLYAGGWRSSGCPSSWICSKAPCDLPRRGLGGESGMIVLRVSPPREQRMQFKPLLARRANGRLKELITRQCGDSLRPVGVQSPEGVEGRHVQQFAGRCEGAGHDHFAAVFLDALVTTQQKREEHRADVIDLAEIEDETDRRIGASGASTIWAACSIRFSGSFSTSGDGMMTAMSPCRSMPMYWCLVCSAAIISIAFVSTEWTTTRIRLPRPFADSSAMRVISPGL